MTAAPSAEQCPRCQTAGTELRHGFGPIYVAGLWLVIAVVAGTAVGSSAIAAVGLSWGVLAAATLAATVPALFTLQALWQFWRIATSERTRLRCPRCESEWDLPAS